MRSISIFLIVSALSYTSFGQSNNEPIPFDYYLFKANKLLYHTFDDPHTPLATAQRCVRAAVYNDNVLIDSVVHYYSGTRGTNSAKDNLEPNNAHDSFYRWDIENGAFYLGSQIKYDSQNRFIRSSVYSSTVPHAYIGYDTALYNSNGTRTFYESNIDDLNNVKQYKLIINDTEGKILQDTFYQYSYGSGFDWITSTNYAYDNNNRTTLRSSYQSYNNATYSELISTKSFYTGNNDVAYLDSITKIINNNPLYTSKQAVYHFYANQKLIADTVYNQNGTLSNATNYTYTSNTVTSITRLYNNGSWTPSARTITKKNNEGLQSSTEHQSWDAASNVWQMTSGDSATFDNAGYITERISYQSNNNSIVVLSKLTTERNNFNNSTVNTYKYYDAQGNLLYNSKAYYYYTEYEDGTTGMSNPKQQLKVTVFPNPTSDYVRIAVKDDAQKFNILLLDMKGNEVMRQSFHQTETVLDLKELSDGIYLLVLKDDKNNASFTQKILKQ